MKIENIEKIKYILEQIRKIDSKLKSNKTAYMNSEGGIISSRMIKVGGIQIDIDEPMAKFVLKMNRIDLQNKKKLLEDELETL